MVQMLEGKGTLPEWWGCMTRRLSGPAEAVLARPGQPEHQNSDNTGLCVCVCVSHSVMSDSATPWTEAHQAPLSMGFSRQE